MKVLQSHYQCLGSCSVDDAFDDNWKQEADSKVNECHRCSVEHDDPGVAGDKSSAAFGRPPSGPPAKA